MSTFNSAKSYEVSSSFIPNAIDAVKTALELDGFHFERKPGTHNKTVIEVTKENLVKHIVGLNQGLRITFESEGEHVNVDAKGIVLKNQLIASTISFVFFWPVLIPQIIGLIKQSKLDERAIAIVDSAYSTYMLEAPVFCTHCGGRITKHDTRCPHCSANL